MKHLIKTTTLALGLSACAVSAYAQDTTPTYDEPVYDEDVIVTPGKDEDSVWFHADANLALMQYSVTEGNTEFVSDNLTAAFFRAGVKYKYVGAEVEYGTGLSGIEEGGIESSVNSQISGFAMGRLPYERGDFFVRLGYHSSDVEVIVDDFQFGRVDLSEKDTGIAFGLGGTYHFTDNFGLRADITGYNLSDPLDVSYVGGSLGVAARF